MVNFSTGESCLASTKPSGSADGARSASLHVPCDEVALPCFYVTRAVDDITLRCKLPSRRMLTSLIESDWLEPAGGTKCKPFSCNSSASLRTRVHAAPAGAAEDQRGPGPAGHRQLADLHGPLRHRDRQVLQDAQRAHRRLVCAVPSCAAHRSNGTGIGPHGHLSNLKLTIKYAR